MAKKALRLTPSGMSGRRPPRVAGRVASEKVVPVIDISIGWICLQHAHRAEAGGPREQRFRCLLLVLRERRLELGDRRLDGLEALEAHRQPLLLTFHAVDEA